MNCRIPKEETKASGNLQMNLYDLNKQIISQMPALDKDGIDLALMTVATYIKNTENKYYMLLCKDVNYYTKEEATAINKIKNQIRNITNPSLKINLPESKKGTTEYIELKEKYNLAIAYFNEKNNENIDKIEMR